jgi:predicted metal-dependent HD superfamily phosphohydrolase
MSKIVKAAEVFIRSLYEKELTPDHMYHNIVHTLADAKTGAELGELYRLSEEEIECIELAMLFHDSGYTKIYEGHETVSQEIAETFLREHGYPEDKIQKVVSLIEVTRINVEPTTLMEKIVKDADFNTLDGRFFDKSSALRHEWKVFLKKEMTELEWVEVNLKFWEGHRFYTGEAQARFGEEKRKTIKQFKKQLQSLLGTIPDGEKLEVAISQNKSALLIFKTTLRNHVDLTNIADNKANIMLSINSLLITIGIPMLAGNLEKFPNLIFPAATLLITCILSIIFATLSTRPVKMVGTTNISKITDGETNLFFFGNYYKMSIEEYRSGLNKVLQNEAILDRSIITDLFSFGRTLGAKFSRLRICYEIFMVGMIITVITFGVVLFIWKK